MQFKKKTVAPQQTAASKSHIPPKFKAKPSPAAVDDDDEDESLEQEEDIDEDEEDEGDEEEEQPKVKTQAKAKGKSSSLANSFDAVPASNNADTIPPGKYEAIIRSAVLQEPEAKGQSIRINFELCSPDFGDANQITTWFRIFDSDQVAQVGGIRAFKGAMAKLGEEVAFSELPDLLDKLTEDQPGVVLKVVYTKDQQGNTWQRATIDALCENDVVEEYKEKMAY